MEEEILEKSFSESVQVSSVDIITIRNNSVSYLLEHIHSLKNRYKCSLVDAIIYYSEQTGLDIEDVAERLKKDENFVQSLREEAIKDRFLRETDGFKHERNLADFL